MTMAAELPAAMAEVKSKTTLGVNSPRSEKSTMPRDSMSSIENAATEMGVSCKLSSRLRAVTMISSSALA